MRPAGQVLQGFLPELVASCSFMFFLERKTQRCPRNGPRELTRGRTECCGRAKATPKEAGGEAEALGGGQSSVPSGMQEPDSKGVSDRGYLATVLEAPPLATHIQTVITVSLGP